MRSAQYLQSTLDGAMAIDVEVQPGAKRQGILGLNTWRGRLRVAVRAHAQRGEANNALLHVLSTALEVPQSSLSIVSGTTSKLKKVRIEAAYADLATLRLQTHLEESE